MWWGRIQVDVVSVGQLRLDGGAMFGVVPKSMWGARLQADSSNRIRLALNCLLIRTDDLTVLVDTGCGDKYTRKQADIYGVDLGDTIVDGLRRIDVAPEDVDVVINTHLHFDHCGGNTRWVEGALTPSFPRAAYWVRREEYEQANRANERTAASYLPDNWLPLEERGQLQLVESECEVAPGLRLLHTPGHTPGHQSVLIQSEGRSLLYLGDLCPTSQHVPLPWISAYDLDPLVTLEVRRRLYAKACDESWLLLFEHDPDTLAGYLRRQGGKYILVPAPWDRQANLRLGAGRQPPQPPRGGNAREECGPADEIE
jgi:glyoxylase-like metal-dependent hydrolase (beta-lactamase superfamily II)